MRKQLRKVTTWLCAMAIVITSISGAKVVASGVSGNTSADVTSDATVTTVDNEKNTTIEELDKETTEAENDTNVASDDTTPVTESDTSTTGQGSTTSVTEGEKTTEMDDTTPETKTNIPTEYEPDTITTSEAIVGPTSIAKPTPSRDITNESATHQGGEYNLGFDPEELKEVICVGRNDLVLEWAYILKIDGLVNPWYGDGGQTLMFQFDANLGQIIEVTVNGRATVDDVITEKLPGCVKINPTLLENNAYHEITVKVENGKFMAIIKKGNPIAPPIGTTESNTITSFVEEQTMTTTLIETNTMVETTLMETTSEVKTQVGTAIEEQTTTEMETITKEQLTTEQVTTQEEQSITEVETTTEEQLTTEQITTSEGQETTEVETTIEGQSTTAEQLSTIKEPSITATPTTTALVKSTTKAKNEKLEIEFNYNGGKGSVKSKVVEKEKKYGELPLAQRRNYKFDGWYTQSGQLITKDKTVDFEGVQKLYAHWTKITVSKKISIKRFSQKKGKITINVANAKKKASGYVVYCSYNKKFKKAKSFDVKNKNQCTFIVKKVLKKARPGWTYYYRIRPYVIDSTRKKVWGKYGKTYARLYRDK